MSTKENVLKDLEEKKGSFISGEELAGKLGLSRNSIWKSVRDLRKSGYNIESVTNKGYSLNIDSDIISVQGIATYLSHKELMKDIEVYDEIASTNLMAKERVVLKQLERRVIVAKKQTDGQAHGKKSFSSPDGGVYLSIIINPDIIKYTNLPILAAVIVSDVLEKEEFFGLGNNDNDVIGIEWINSIYKGNEKISGILTESISDMETGEISSYILGIGINYKLSNKNKTIAKIIERIFYIDEYYSDDKIIEKYQKRLMHIDKRVKFILYGDKKDEFYAVILGMDNSGKLIVKKDDGTKLYLDKGFLAV